MMQNQANCSRRARDLRDRAALELQLRTVARHHRRRLPPAGLHRAGNVRAITDHVLTRADPGGVPADLRDVVRLQARKPGHGFEDGGDRPLVELPAHLGVTTRKYMLRTLDVNG